jgi:hypothetical protein
VDSERIKNLNGFTGAAGERGPASAPTPATETGRPLSARARRRRAFHLARIAAAPEGSRQRESAALDWLRAELASGGDLTEVQDLADLMNLRSE